MHNSNVVVKDAFSFGAAVAHIDFVVRTRTLEFNHSDLDVSLVSRCAQKPNLWIQYQVNVAMTQIYYVCVIIHFYIPLEPSPKVSDQ